MPTLTAQELLLHFYLLNAPQISVVGNPDLEPHREGNSVKYSFSLVKLGQYKATMLIVVVPLLSPVEGKRITLEGTLKQSLLTSLFPGNLAFEVLGQTENKRNLPVILPPKDNFCEHFGVNSMLSFS